MHGRVGHPDGKGDAEADDQAHADGKKSGGGQIRSVLNLKYIVDIRHV